MRNFDFKNPTRLVFGKDCVSRKLRDLLPDGTRKILLTYGGGSVIKNGIYDTVMASLEGYDVVPFGGIEANPDVHTLERAITTGRETGIDFILAVGGGSVLDGSKLIAAGIRTPRLSAWEIVRSGEYDGFVPMGTVLTVPATGSEMNRGAVISNRALGEKYAFYSEYPLFSLLDPTYTYTLPPKQVAAGIADTFVHILEQYLTYPGQSGVMDRMAEGVLLNVLDFAPLRLEKNDDYDVASEYLLSVTMGLNGFLGMGVEQDWATHRIGHEFTALLGITHGVSLVMILPSLLRVLKAHKLAKTAQLGRRVFGLQGKTDEELFEPTVQAIEQFIRSLGLPASLKEGGVPRETGEEVARRFKERGTTLGEGGICTPDKIREIIEKAYE